MLIVHLDPAALRPPVTATHLSWACTSSSSSERGGDPPAGPMLVSSSAGKQRFSFFDVSLSLLGPVAHKAVVLMVDARPMGPPLGLRQAELRSDFSRGSLSG
jgi:hypothetical protein